MVPELRKEVGVDELEVFRVRDDVLEVAGALRRALADADARVERQRPVVDERVEGGALQHRRERALAVLARAHCVPFYVAAPVSTFDRATPTGAAIAIEEREAHEVSHGFGRQTGPDGVRVYNPAFDVTPHELVAAIVTEVGVLRPTFAEAIAELPRVRNTAVTPTS